MWSGRIWSLGGMVACAFGDGVGWRAGVEAGRIFLGSARVTEKRRADRQSDRCRVQRSMGNPA